MVSFISSLLTILSINPCSSKNSAVWNSSGNFSPIVCSITLCPANPIFAPGSAKMISPKLANDAVTPPYVGSVSTDMYNNPASFSFVNAAVVFCHLH